MRYNIREYAVCTGINAYDLFTMAWKEYFKQIPARSSIDVDVEAYLSVGAVPPYMLSYMKDKSIPKKVYKPHWIAA